MQTESTDEGTRPGLDRYFAGLRGRPLLSREQELALSRAIRKGDRAALNELVEANLGFVIKIAGEYRSLGTPFEDLLNEGNLGLIEAARRFDGKRGTRFVTCAVWWIRKSILRALNENNGLVRVPATQQRRFRELQSEEKELSRELGRAPRREELSRRVSKSLSKVEALMQADLREFSLDATIHVESDTPMSEFVADGREIGPEEELLRSEAHRLVGEAVEKLSEKERAVISTRFGLTGGKPLVLKDVGAILGVSRERVRQIESQALKRLRRMLAKSRFSPGGTPGVPTVRPRPGGPAGFVN
jgi:RNA polymerase primary sigma factor